MSGIKTILSKYKSMPKELKVTLWFTICNFVQRGMSMITTPLFARLMPTEEYGLFGTYTAWENVLFMIVSLSLYKSLMNLYVKYEDYEKVLSAICGLELVLTGSVFAVGVCMREQLAELLKISSPLVCCLLINFMSQAAIQSWAIYKRYIYDYISLIVSSLVLSVGTTVLSIVLVCAISSTAFMRALSITTITCIVGMLVYGSVFRRGKTFYDGNVWLFAIRFCVPLMPHYLSEFVLQSSDRLMINYMCGPSDVAVYSIAYAVGSLINLFANSVNASFMPYIFQKLKSKEYNKISGRANQVLCIIGILLAGIMLFGREIVMIFGGPKYIDSVDIIIPISLGVFFNYLFSFFGQIQQYYERKKALVIPSLLCAFLNIILNYIFIGYIGYKAAAYTTFFCYLLFCVLHYFLYKKACAEEIGGIRVYDIKIVLIVSAALIVFGIATYYLNRLIYIKYIMLIGFMVLILAFRKRVAEILREIKKK